MNDEAWLTVGARVLGGIFLASQWWLWWDRKRSRERLRQDWADFEQAFTAQHLEKMQTAGLLLVHNPYLKPR